MKDNTKIFRNQHARSQIPKQNAISKRYLTGIDGLRALSVLAVIAYHLSMSGADGGFIGVGIFFVISGYLITDQIITQWERHRKLNILNFWVRRIRRLVPAMVVMMLVVAIWLLFIDPSRLIELKGAFLSSIFYYNNWYLIFHNVSYFESFGPPSPIGHLWSLAIEGQFYMLWPIIFITVMKIARQKRRLIAWIMTCALISAFAMALIYAPGTDPSRVYYGTDTRVFALLIGAALAVAWPSQKLNERISPPARNMLDLVGLIGLILLLVFFNQVSEYDDLLYRGGFFVISIITAVVIAVLAHPASRLGTIMGCKPLRWIGERSYSLYIWHFPVIILSTPNVDTDGVNILRLLIQLGVSFLLAALSYKYVEEPIRRGNLKELWKNRHSNGRLRLRPGVLIAMIAVVLVPIACKGYLLNAVSDTSASQSPGTKQEQQLNDIGIKGDSVGQNDSDLAATPQPSELPLTQESKDSDKKDAGAVKTTPSPTPEANKPDAVKAELNVKKTDTEAKKPVAAGTRSGEGITAIGDSVILDAKPYLEKELPGINIQGKIGRQMIKAQEVVDQLKAENRLGKQVIIELGTNGPFNSKQLGNLLDSLSDVEQVVLVNTRVPERWQNSVNSTLSRVYKDYSNTTLVDWYSASEGKDNWFYHDGVHLKPDGSEFYANMLLKALN